MALIEYLLFRYKQTIKELLSRPQVNFVKMSNKKGESEELKKAEANLKAVQEALVQMQKELDALKQEEQETQKKMKELEAKSNDAKVLSISLFL